ncbi:oxidoreductase [Litorivivens sp.]|uniref:oxidoreductase n=1 Tax=Litorivivens sp. TaxID=2020868 RepID=UPI00356AAE99
MPHKTAVVTGANSGLGFGISCALAERGYQVIMACRNLQKAADAKQQLLTRVPGANALVIQLDVSDLKSIAAFGEQFKAQVGALDLLINNAGIVAMPFERNSLGHEMQFATNYLGAFALTGTMLPLFRDSGSPRVVNIGSLAHRFGKLVLDDLNWEKEEYNEWQGYARSKVAMLTFTLELDRRLKAAGSPVTALAAHPGFANTNAGNSPSVAPKGPIRRKMQAILTPLIPTADAAARSALLAACGDSVQGGDYYGPRGLFEIGGKPGKAKLNPQCRDEVAAKQLWNISESLSGVAYLS